MVGWFIKSLRNKALVIFVLLSILPLLTLGIISNIMTTSALESKTNFLANQSISSLALSLSRDFQNLVDATVSCADDPRLTEWIDEPKDSADEKDRAFFAIKGLIVSNVMVDKLNYPYQFILLDNSGSVYTNFTYSSGDMYQDIPGRIMAEPWFKSLHSSDYRQLVLFSHYDYLNEKITAMQQGSQLIVAANIVNNSGNKGLFLLGVDSYYFTKLLKNSKASGRSSVYLIDLKGNCLLEGDDNFHKFTTLSPGLLSGMSESKETPSYLDVFNTKQMVICKNLSVQGLDTQWRVVMLTPVDDINEDIRNISYTTIILLAASLVAVCILILIINREIINPVVELNQKMKEVRNGNLNVLCQVVRKDEIGQLGLGFNTMVGNLRQDIDSIQKHEEQKRKLEFKVLQSHINPHFAINTLSTIRMMAEMKKATGVSKSIQSFSKLLEYNFREFDVLVTVKMELEYLQEYLYIQNLRYQNKFEFSIRVEEEILDCMVLKLLFQPIVENCIFHGLENKKGQGYIEITGKMCDNNLVFTIRDDGIGMTKETADHLFEDKDDGCENGKFTGGIALPNLQQRIKLHFGDAYGMAVYTSPGNGTETIIVLPTLRKKPQGVPSENPDC